MICGEDHYTKGCPHREEVNKFLKGNSQPIVLTNPFPPQHQQMVAQNPAPLKGGHAGHPSQVDASTCARVLMCTETIDLNTRAKTYDIFPKRMPMEVLMINPIHPLLLHFLSFFIYRNLFLTP